MLLTLTLHVAFTQGKIRHVDEKIACRPEPFSPHPADGKLLVTLPLDGPAARFGCQYPDAARQRVEATAQAAADIIAGQLGHARKIFQGRRLAAVTFVCRAQGYPVAVFGFGEPVAARRAF